ncbi:MAG: GNAT family N-acetyltransferase [Chloroflexota bacterium]|nr:MAG: GNAT family N-acetyltransferase [Chloroflexota bacterium]
MVCEGKRDLLLAMLPENPETVIWIHLLTQDACNVYTTDNQSPRLVAVLQSKDLPTEPAGFGSDANALWQELTHVKGWQCILVDKEVAPPLGEIISSQLKTRVRFLDDVYHIPRGRILPFECESIRRLQLDDLTLLEALPSEAQPIGFWGDLRTSLIEGLAVGAIAQGQVVAASFVAARGQRYADIGVYVLEKYRQQGLATAAASLVARSVQIEGLIPVWSCGSDNFASLKLARKLGFSEISRRTYVVIQEYLANVSGPAYPVPNERERKRLDEAVHPFGAELSNHLNCPGRAKCREDS